LRDVTKKKVLFITLRSWWLGVSRLPGGLREAGFAVAAWCPTESFLARTDAVERHFPWKGHEEWTPRLREIVAEWQPDIIIPGDETIAVYLRTLAAQSPLLHPKNAQLRQILRRSLGNPKTTRALDGKIAFQRLARSLGVRTPDDRPVADFASALAVAEELRYPVVLKDEFAAGGVGVKVCRDAEELSAGWDELESVRRSPVTLRDKLRQMLDTLRGKAPHGRSLQKFIQGKPAFHAVAAWEGRRLAGVTARVEVTDPPGTGPSCVVRLCENSEISTACARIIRATGMSGFAGFDFMIEDKTGRAYILECNPRPTPVSHLGGLIDNDLCTAFHAAVENRPATPTPRTVRTAGQVVAFYPQEVLRDPQSPYLATAHLDIPWDDASLMAALRERYPDLPRSTDLAEIGELEEEAPQPRWMPTGRALVLA